MKGKLDTLPFAVVTDRTPPPIVLFGVPIARTTEWELTWPRMSSRASARLLDLCEAGDPVRFILVDGTQTTSFTVWISAQLHAWTDPRQKRVVVQGQAFLTLL